MLILIRHLSRILFIVATTTALNATYAAESPEKRYPNILRKSPFLPEDYNRKQEVPITKPSKMDRLDETRYQFKGFIKLEDTWRFSIYDNKEKKNTWLKEGETKNELRLKSYNIEDKKIIVEHSGKAIELLIAQRSASPTFTPTPPVTMPTRNIDRVTPPPNKQPNRRVIPRRRVIIPPKK